MKRSGWFQHGTLKNYFPLPNAIFLLGLKAGELAVYAYLLYCEDRTTYQCWPSYRTIGKAVTMSINTVRKHVSGLVERSLITTEPTSIHTQDGRTRNGSLRYTIRPIGEAIEQFYAGQMELVKRDTQRHRAEQMLAKTKAEEERPA